MTTKVKSAFAKLRSSPPREGETPKEEKEGVPKSVKEGSFGGEASHLRMQM